MYCNFTAHKPLVYGSSCSQQMAYLTKEDQGLEAGEEAYFFNNERSDITLLQAVNIIDENKGSHSNSQSKFYMMNLSPSPRELAHIEGLVNETLEHRAFSSDADQAVAKDITMRIYLQEYVNNAMEVYAQNFERDLTIDDLVYTAKIEKNRTYKDFERDVKHNNAIDKLIRDNPIEKDKIQAQYKRDSQGIIIRKGMQKEGLNYHAHVIVSRYEKKGTQREKRSLSPMSKGKQSKGLNNSKVGFNRDAYNEKLQQNFDVLYNYERPIFERYAHQKQQYKQKALADDISSKMKYQVQASVKSLLKEQGILPKEIPISLSQMQSKALGGLDKQLHLRDIKTLIQNPKQFAIQKTIAVAKIASRGLDLGM